MNPNILELLLRQREQEIAGEGTNGSNGETVALVLLLRPSRGVGNVNV